MEAEKNNLRKWETRNQNNYTNGQTFEKIGDTNWMNANRRNWYIIPRSLSRAYVLFFYGSDYQQYITFVFHRISKFG